MIQTPWFVSYFYNKKRSEIWDKIPWTNVEIGFTHELYFFRGTAVILYCFVCHGGELPIINSLHNNVVSTRVQKVIKRTVAIQYILYILIAISGFLTAPINAHHLIVFRHNYVFDNDIFMIVGQITLTAVLLLVIPVKYSILRIACCNLIFGSSEFSFRK